MAAASLRRPGSCFVWGFILALAVFCADQYSKWFVIETVLKTQEIIPGFKGWFLTFHQGAYVSADPGTYKTVPLMSSLNLVMVWNKGISFGLFQSGSKMASLALIGIALSLSMGMLIWLALSRSVWVSFALALVVGGAVGNMIDRIRFGAVADFIDFYVNDWHWPAFNVADSAIVLGAFILILNMAFSKEA